MRIKPVDIGSSSQAPGARTAAAIRANPANRAASESRARRLGNAPAFRRHAGAADDRHRIPLDGTGATADETLYLFDGDAIEPALRCWSARVDAASPLPPRLPERRLTGWCSWYNHHAAIDAARIAREIVATAAFRDTHRVPLDLFQVDDGFTPEMGDWLDVKPQFPHGMAPLLAQAAAAGFRPGLWIAPFLVGNRSALAAAHSDWLVGDRATGEPLIAFSFHGEFRWHKRSEEYQLLDVTHPDALAYLAAVIGTWTRD